jgi:hypothetical protein
VKKKNDMKVIITKKQYTDVVYKLLSTYLGKLRYNESDISITIYGKNDLEDDTPPMTIWTGPQRSKGCKKDLTLDYDFTVLLSQFIPLTRKKIFSDVLIKYIYDKTGIKCDCVDYHYGFERDDETAQNYRFNVKKRKKTTSR